MKKALIGTVAAIALVAGASAPAAARPYWGGGYGHYHGGYYSGGDALGGFLLGGLLIGGAVAIASSANRDAPRPVYQSSSVEDVRDAGAEARAVTAICSDAAEGMAHSRITGIDSVGRDGRGWRVDGTVADERGNRPFSCGTSFGRVDFVHLG